VGDKADTMTTTRPPTLGAAARVQGATVRFRRPRGGGDLVALDDVSFTLREGELLVLVGRSGSGKTTALNLLAGLVEPSLGTVETLGVTPAQARRRTGYMLARDALLPWRTARANVSLGLELLPGSRRERREVADRHLAAVGMSEHATHFPNELSQGQRQRVALARTWATQPDLLLMDEPFSAVDPETRERLHVEFLEHWQRTASCSAVFVTHDLNEGIALADRILVFDGGRIVKEFEVPFPRPRDLLTITRDPQALDVYNEIREVLAGPVSPDPHNR
jgi:NitT/TauT family transport system ATP-binding protein